MEGWDYLELSSLFGLDESEGAIREFLASKAQAGDVDPEIAKTLREWLKLLAENAEVGYYTPFFRGILAVEDDWTLVQVVIHCLELLWV